MLKNAETYEIMRPEDVGQGATNLVMGKHSGRHAFREKLKALGYELAQERAERGLRAVQGAGRQEEARLRRRHRRPGRTTPWPRAADRIQVKRLRVVAGTDGPQTRRADPGHRRRGEEGCRPPATARWTRCSTPSARSFRTPAMLRALSGPRRHRGHRRPGPGHRCVWKRTAGSPPAQSADTDTWSPAPRPMSNALNNLFARKEKAAPDSKVGERVLGRSILGFANGESRPAARPAVASGRPHGIAAPLPQDDGYGREFPCCSSPSP